MFCKEVRPPVIALELSDVMEMCQPCMTAPGKTAPKTAGEIIAETVCHILEERRMIHEETGG